MGDETSGFTPGADGDVTGSAAADPGEPRGAVHETLAGNEWVSLKRVRKPDSGVYGYVYSHETRCHGRIVAVLPYRATASGEREYLVKSEMTPCWGFGRVRSAVTGGWEGGDIADDAVHEMLEETGYEITRADLIPLGESFASKSADTVYTLFGVDLTGKAPGEALGDGTEQPNQHEWVTAGGVARVMDPQVSVMLVRLEREQYDHAPAGDLAELSTQLSTIEDWLRQDCPARHASEMADVIHRAWRLADDVCDQGAAIPSARGAQDGHRP